VGALAHPSPSAPTPPAPTPLSRRMFIDEIVNFYGLMQHLFGKSVLRFAKRL